MVVEYQSGWYLHVFLPCCLQKQNLVLTKAELISSQLKMTLFKVDALYVLVEIGRALGESYHPISRTNTSPAFQATTC